MREILKTNFQTVSQKHMYHRQIGVKKLESERKNSSLTNYFIKN